MIFPLIRVRAKGDSHNGYLLGSDVAHHKLILDDNGSLKFHNIQCSDGTGKHGSFEFVTTEGYWGDEIDFGDIWDILDIYKKHLRISKFQLDKEYDEAIRQLKAVFDNAIELKAREDEQIIQNLFEEFYKEKTEEEIKSQEFMQEVERRRKLIYMSIPEFSQILGITAMQYCYIRDGRESLNKKMKHNIEALLKNKGV